MKKHSVDPPIVSTANSEPHGWITRRRIALALATTFGIAGLQGFVDAQTGEVDKPTFGMTYYQGDVQLRLPIIRMTGSIYVQHTYSNPNQPSSALRHTATYQAGSKALLLRGCTITEARADSTTPIGIVELGIGEPVYDREITGAVTVHVAEQAIACSGYVLQD